MSNERTVIDLRPDELIIDNFAGGGGASLGIEQALGRHIDIAINHDQEALTMHIANHPHTKHFIESVWDVDPKKVCAGRPVGLAWFSPDCFPVGTMVLAREGYRRIEQLTVGDEVLTHMGRWRRITEVSSTHKPLTRVYGYGHPGLSVSHEHPFYARQREDVWNNDRRSYDRILKPARWAPASILDHGWYWSTPAEFPVSEVPPISVLHRRETTVTASLMWLVGRYIADGWTRLTASRAELVITCGHHEVGGLRKRIDVWPRAGSRCGSDELSWQERETGTAYQFTASHRGLVQWLRDHFGHGAAEKHIPGWALGMSEDLRRALLDGYLSGDGWEGQHHGVITECRTVSKALAFGIKALATSLGKSVAVYTGANTNMIGGRPVNALPYWQLRWREHPVDGHRQTFREGHLEWSPIRGQEDAIDAEVFNIGVAEDESYVVEGIVVHNCKHHSKARGSKPVDKKIRGLAWVVVRWARAVRPRVIALENVSEFKEWGSVIHAVDEDGKLRHHKDGKPIMVPNPKRTGATFRRWKRELEKLGYKVEYRELKAHEYGAPTIRKRLFIIARCDGLPIRWPEQTHGPGKLPYRTAAECIDFSIPVDSIFERERKGKRPLVEGTLRRIAAGVKRYVLDAKEPFIVRTGHRSNITGEGFGFRGQGINKPLATVCTTNDKAMVVPYMAGAGGGPARAGEPRPPVDVSMNTLLSKSDQRLTVPFLAGVGGRAGQSRPRGVNEPIATVTAKADQGMAVPIMVRADAPVPNGECTGGKAVAAPLLLKFRHWSHGADLKSPLHTISAEGQHHGLVVPYLVGAGGPSYSGKPRGVDGPMPTLLAENHQCVVAPHLVGIDHRSSGDSAAWDAKKPLTTITAENRHAVVASFIVKQYGGHESPGWPLDKPLSTITTVDHHWPAMLKLMPEQAGAYDRTDHSTDVSAFLREFLGEKYADGIVHLPDGDYRIVDLSLRMLKPAELFLAQGFTREYIINPMFNGKPLTATAQVRMCGNSVSPVMSRAIILANFSRHADALAA